MAPINHSRDARPFMTSGPQSSSSPLTLEKYSLGVGDRFAEQAALKYLFAVKEAGRIYRHLKEAKGSGFITEVSMDETDSPQTPAELLVILAAIGDEHIPIQTIAPKFTGRFNKGVDYVGNP